MTHRFLRIVFGLLAASVLALPVAAQDTSAPPLTYAAIDGDTLILVTPDGVQTLAPLPPFFVGQLTWTPDGGSLAYVVPADDGSSAALVLVRLDGTTQTFEVPPVADPSQPVAFSEDGTIAYLLAAGEPTDDVSNDGMMLPAPLVEVLLEDGRFDLIGPDVTFGVGCGGGSPYPMDAAYERDAGFMGNRQEVAVTPFGVLHTVNCVGVGLALTSLDDGTTIPLEGALTRPALSPDRVLVAGVVPETGTSAPGTLEIIDLASGQVIPLATTASPERVAWGPEGTLLYTTRTVSGTLPSDVPGAQAIGAQLGEGAPPVPTYTVTLRQYDPSTQADNEIAQFEAVWDASALFSDAGSIYVSIIPGPAAWGEALAADPSLDVFSEQAFVLGEEAVAPILYRIDGDALIEVARGQFQVLPQPVQG